MSKSRGWCLTINNFTEDDIEKIKLLKCEYCFQEETGENGTPHLQGMLYFKNARDFKQIKKIFETAHIEKMKNKLASMKYCTKEETRTGKIYTNIKMDNIDTVDTHNTVKKDRKNFEELLIEEKKLTDMLMNIYIKDKEKFEKLKKQYEEHPAHKEFIWVEEFMKIKL